MHNNLLLQQIWLDCICCLPMFQPLLNHLISMEASNSVCLNPFHQLTHGMPACNINYFQYLNCFYNNQHCILHFWQNKHPIMSIIVNQSQIIYIYMIQSTSIPIKQHHNSGSLNSTFETYILSPN